MFNVFWISDYDPIHVLDLLVSKLQFSFLTLIIYNTFSNLFK